MSSEWAEKQICIHSQIRNSDVRPLFAQTKEIAGKRPNAMITDAPNFHDAFNKEFFTLSGPRTLTYLISVYNATTIKAF
jgi:hypothetical protein